MRQILIAAIATFGLAGIAAAQEAYGPYGYGVDNTTLQTEARSNVQAPATQVQGLDYSTTSSYSVTVPAQQGAASTMELAERAHF